VILAGALGAILACAALAAGIASRQSRSKGADFKLRIDSRVSEWGERRMRSRSRANRDRI
jgi:hypothetical protein